MANLNNRIAGELFQLRDYHHAAKSFASDAGYIKAPYKGSGFHVNMSFNNIVERTNSIQTKDISVLVRSTDLPEVRFETETLNQYNRKRIIKKKVEYQPIRINFRDDIAQNVRSMWIAYNQYYSADSNYPGRNFFQYDDVYNDSPFSRRYGLDNKSQVPFINNIDIYSMGDKTYSKQSLINPLITSAAFTDHDYSDIGRTQELSLTIEYETILYSRGGTDDIPNFGLNNSSNYDVNYTQLKNEASSFILDYLKEKLPDTPIINTVLTMLELQQRTGDFSPGKVGEILSDYANRSAEFEQTKREIERAILSSSTPLFPDSTNNKKVFSPSTTRTIPNLSSASSNNQSLSMQTILQESADTNTVQTNNIDNPSNTYPNTNITRSSLSNEVTESVNRLSPAEYQMTAWNGSDDGVTTIELIDNGSFANNIKTAPNPITKDAAIQAALDKIKNQFQTLNGNVHDLVVLVKLDNELIGQITVNLAMAGAPPVKKSDNSGICWAWADEDNNAQYNNTIHYTPFESMEACLASGGRESNSG